MSFTMNTSKLSVLLCVCHKDNPAHFVQALESVVNQTRPPDQVVIVADGPLTDGLNRVLEDFRGRRPLLFTVARLAANQGPAQAWNYGLARCEHELVARMDADDVCLPERMEKQLSFLRKHPQVDVLGSYYSEFENNDTKPIALFRPPAAHAEICRYARTRNPLCHPSVMYKKSSVMANGGYIEIPGFTDYYLWIRMIESGCVLANIPEVLLHYRGGREVMARRGGTAYIRNEYVFFRESYKMGFISFAGFAGNVMIRPFVRVMPASIRKIIYRKLLRDPV